MIKNKTLVHKYLFILFISLVSGFIFANDVSAEYWEPWEVSPTEYHPWDISYWESSPGTGEYNPPVIINSSLSLNLLGSGTSEYEGTYSYISWNIDDDTSGILPANSENLTIKVNYTFDGIISGNYNYFRIAIIDQSGARVFLHFFSDHEEVFPYSFGGHPYVYVGKNNGEEMTIDLSSYNIQNITYMEIGTYMDYNSRIEWTIDYIDFDNDIGELLSAEGESCISDSECDSDNCLLKPDSTKVCATADKECADSSNNGVDIGYKECYNGDSWECIGLNSWTNTDCANNCGLYANVDSCSANECQSCATSCSSDNDCDISVICTIDNVCMSDLDNDGIIDENDPLQGDETNVELSGILTAGSLEILIDGDTNITKPFIGDHDIVFKDKDEDVCLIFFRHNFSETNMDLSTINIHKGMNGMHIQGLNLNVGQKKTVCVSAPEVSSKVCLKDDPGITLDAMTDDCSGDGEILFAQCNVSGQTIGEYYCYYNTTYGVYLINSTSHTGAKELGNARLGIWDDTDSGTKYALDDIVFYANYTNLSSGDGITGADCDIWFDDWANWSDMNPDNVHNFTRSFATSGINNWNVSCSATGFTLINTNDTSYITSNVIPEFNILTILLALSAILCGMLFIRRKR